jgi:hypothetical protein
VVLYVAALLVLYVLVLYVLYVLVLYVLVLVVLYVAALLVCVHLVHTNTDCDDWAKHYDEY